MQQMHLRGKHLELEETSERRAVSERNREHCQFLFKQMGEKQRMLDDEREQDMFAAIRAQSMLEGRTEVWRWLTKRLTR